MDGQSHRAVHGVLHGPSRMCEVCTIVARAREVCAPPATQLTCFTNSPIAPPASTAKAPMTPALVKGNPTAPLKYSVSNITAEMYYFCAIPTICTPITLPTGVIFVYLGISFHGKIFLTLIFSITAFEVQCALKQETN